LRARHRLGKFLLRHGKRPESAMKTWTGKYRDWLQRKVHFEIAALEATFLDYVHEVSHQAERITELEKASDSAIVAAPEQIRAVIEALQALRGIAKITAVTIVAEVGSFSRFENPRSLMGYSGMVASEFTTGNRVRRGGITKTGNAHLRRVVGELPGLTNGGHGWMDFSVSGDRVWNRRCRVLPGKRKHV
jgi:transposase